MKAIRENSLTQEQIWDNIGKDWHVFRNKIPEEVKEFLEKQKGNVLDLGCGSGRNFFKNLDVIYYGVDFSEKMLKFAEKKVEKEKIDVKLIKTNAEKLPFEDNFFDAAIFISTLHCIETQEKREKTLRELHRVLKPDSKLMLTVWDRESNKIRALGEVGKEFYMNWKSRGKTYKRYIYVYDENELKEELEKAGFKVLKILERDGAKSKHAKKNIIVYCRK